VASVVSGPEDGERAAPVMSFWVDAPDVRDVGRAGATGPAAVRTSKHASTP